ncbi:thioesterase II family protein [Tistrella bauzanensis]
MISLRPPRNTWSRIDPAGWLVGTARAGAAGDAATSGFRLICYPHAGGSTAAFRPWQVVAGDAAALAVLQMPGRDQRLTEAPTVSIAAVADAVASVLTDPETGGATSPVVLYGHSMGTLVALEVAHRLVAAGQPPLLLVLGARVPPHLSTPAARMLDLDDDAFFDGLDRAYGGTPVTVRNDPSMRQHYIRIMRGDFRLSADYITDFAAISAGRPPCPARCSRSQATPTAQRRPQPWRNGAATAPPASIRSPCPAATFSRSSGHARWSAGSSPPPRA